jgi:GT2 family glycosyltransferase
MQLDLSIIIVNYNGKHYLKECLDSIKTHCSSVAHEVIIVDNLSTDGSQEYIKREFPSVVFIENPSNDGFARGNNIGAAKAKGKALLLLNNDTILLDDMRPVVDQIQANAIGAIGIKMLDAEKQYGKSAGRFPSLKELFFFSKLFLSDQGFDSGEFTQDILEVDWIQGSFLMIKKADYDAVNGLDEDYFMYAEDMDFCKKIAEMGKKTVYDSRFSYIHFGGFNKARQPLLINGFKIYVSKHFKSFKNVATFILNLKGVLLKLIPW